MKTKGCIRALSCLWLLLMSVALSAQGIIVHTKDGQQFRYSYEVLDSITVYESDHPVPPLIPQELPFMESFETSLGTFANFTTAGMGAWQMDTQGFAKASETSGTDTPAQQEICYLVSPEISLLNQTDVQIVYEYLDLFNDDPQQHQLMIHTAFDATHPDKGWVALKADHEPCQDWGDWKTANVVLPVDFLGKTVRVAFRSAGISGGASTFCIRKFQIAEKNSDPGGQVPSEVHASNGGFEKWMDDVPDKWSSASSASKGKLSKSTDAHSGKYSVVLEGNSSYNTRLAYQETMLAAGTYTMSFYVKAVTAEGATVRPGVVPVKDGQVGSYRYGNSVGDLSSIEWTKVEWNFDLPADDVYCLVVMNAKQPGKDVLIDEFQLRDAAGQLIIRGDGESSEHPVPDQELASRLEVPALKEGNQLIAHWANDASEKLMDYCLEYDYAKYHSRWVAFRFDGATYEKRVTRKPYEIKPQYPKDPELKKAFLPDDVSFEGYDHGHLCASNDRLFSREANDKTFYMTNMSPQKSTFNQKYWTKFERFVQDLGRNRSFADTLYVVKGGTIEDGQFSARVAGNRIVVPNHYFVALLKVKNNSFSAIGFWVSHMNYDTGMADRKVLKESAVSIDQLEKLTGIDFFHNLPDKIENQVEQTYNLSKWGL